VNNFQIIFIIFVILLGLFLNEVSEENDCRSMVENATYEYKYIFMKGCMIKIGGEWIEDKNIITKIEGKQVEDKEKKK